MSPITEFFRVKSKQLPLRSEPSVSGKIWEYVPRGQILGKLEENENGTWVLVSYSGRKGWLYKPCLKLSDPPWMEKARKELGVNEFPNLPKSNALVSRRGR